MVALHKVWLPRHTISPSRGWGGTMLVSYNSTCRASPRGELRMSINLDSWQFGSHQEQCMRRASECIRLAGLTDDVGVRDQFVKLAEGLDIDSAQRSAQRANNCPCTHKNYQRLRTSGTSASPNYDPDSRRGHCRSGLSLGSVGLFLTGLELASLELANCRDECSIIKRSARLLPNCLCVHRCRKDGERK